MIQHCVGIILLKNSGVGLKMIVVIFDTYTSLILRQVIYPPYVVLQVISDKLVFATMILVGVFRKRRFIRNSDLTVKLLTIHKKNKLVII